MVGISSILRLKLLFYHVILIKQIIMSLTYTYPTSLVVHFVRNRQPEYKASEGETIVVLEFACGRKCSEIDALSSSSVLTCKTCLKAKILDKG